jgi:outer membrane protein
MKLSYIMAAIALSAAANVKADVLGVTAGAEMWQADPTITAGDTGFAQSLNAEDENATGFYLAFEHPIPVLPNLALRQHSVDFNGNTTLAAELRLDGVSFPKDTVLNNQLSLDYTDATLYYELLDNDLLSLDLGLSARFIKADAMVTAATSSATNELSVPLPMLYWNANVGIPGTAATVFFTGNYVNYSDNSFYDARAGLAYDLIDAEVISLAVKLGVQKLDLDVQDQDDIDAKLAIDGAFLALEVDF